MAHSIAQIVATIGPASRSKEIVAKLIENGMDMARLNFSWGTHEEHAADIVTIREAAKNAGRRIPIIQDLSGPRAQDGATHHFDENATTDLTEKDLRDLDFGAKQQVDYVALSFVGNADDVTNLRHEMETRNMHAPIIAKIERTIALKNLDSIIAVADGIMVARGDLGNEVPLEQIPFIQENIIKKSNAAGKPVIVATQMLLSMVENPIPTRAEVTDVAFAIVCGADAVMLSEESAAGKHPAEAVAMMEKIIVEAERHDHTPHPFA